MAENQHPDTDIGTLAEVPRNGHEQTARDQQFQFFKDAGGSLSKKDFQSVNRRLEQMVMFPHLENRLIRKADKATTAQFDHEAEICNKLGIIISPKQEALYCYLRRRNGKYNSPPLRAHGLTDREIFADIIWLTGTTDEYNKYLEHYPAIVKRRFTGPVKSLPTWEYDVNISKRPCPNSPFERVR